MKRFSLHNVVQSYDALFRRAVKAKGNLEPYLQQLANYDEREIREYRAAIELSEDIAIKALGSGMMRGASKSRIRSKAAIFLTPQQTKGHGRPIYRDEAVAAGLNVEALDAGSELWQSIYELYIRTDNFVSTRVDKCIETEEHSFVAPKREEER